MTAFSTANAMDALLNISRFQPAVSADAQGGSECQRTVRIEGLTTGPRDRMPLALDLELGLESKSLPVGALGKRKHGLPDASRHRVSRIHASAHVDRPVVAQDGEAKRSGNARDAIVDEADHEAGVPVFLVTPNPGGPDAVADAPGRAVEHG